MCRGKVEPVPDARVAPGGCTHADHIRIDLATILALPGVCQPPEIDESDRQHQWEVVAKLTTQALERLIQMRGAEGEALRSDLLAQCRTIRDNLEQIAARAPQVLTEYHQRLLQRTNELIAESTLKLKLDDVKLFLFTQVNLKTIKEVMAKLELPMERTHTIMQKWGYTGSACIPMVLHDALGAGKLERGNNVIMCASGGGLNMACVVFQW